MKKLSDTAQEIKKLLPFDQLFEELFPEQVRPNGMALCPWHDDKTPSLKLKSNAGLCFGACGNGKKPKSYDIADLWKLKHSVNFKQAVTELAPRCGISIDHPREKPKQATNSQVVATYDYTDEAGKLLFQVLRYEPKSFKQRRPDPAVPGKWIWSLGDTRRTLYKLPEVIKSDTVWICEGEKDADNVCALGLCGTTAPQGAGKWKTLCQKWGIHEPLRDKHVIICPDNDPAGAAHAEEIAQSLTGFAASVKILSLSGLADKQDISDFIEIHGAGLAKELLPDIAAKSPEYRPAWTGPSLISFSDLMSQELPEPRWIIRDLLPEGLCVLAGAPKIGKSWLAHALSLSVAGGGPALGRFACSPGHVLHLSLEDNPRRFRKRMSMMLGGNPPPDRAFFACEWPDFSEDSKEPDGLDHIHRWLEHHGEASKLVIIDTLQKVRQRKRAKDDHYGRDYRDMEGLQQLAGQYGIAILVIHHQNKGEFKDVFNTISGSTGLTGAADTIWILDKAHRLDKEGSLFISGRDVEEYKAALRFDRETGLWTWLGDAADVETTKDRREIREILRSEGRPMKPAEISDLMEPKKSAGAVQKTLARMVEAGEAARAVGQFGKYTLGAEDSLYSTKEPRLDYL